MTLVAALLSGASHKQDYKSKLDFFETLEAVAFLKSRFEVHLREQLNLVKAQAPLFIPSKSGLNDDLSSVEQPVRFSVTDGMEVEIPHSLAKWKRKFLYDHSFREHEGILVDLAAIRKDEGCDWTHSNYVDQWDWEYVITKEERTMEELHIFVQRISDALKDTEEEVTGRFPALQPKHRREVHFVTTQELESMYSDLDPKAREDAIAKRHGTVCITQIGDVLASGQPHDTRSPDYDDWSMNGDLLVWHEPLQRSLELSSFGIRVDENALSEQLTKGSCLHRSDLQYHRLVLDKQLPYTAGGGIGQSRVAMYLLEKRFIGEVQCSVWPAHILEQCHAQGIIVL